MNGVSSQVCADCGASDPGWASLNHGVLICSDCCFVHRNLGRHISQIRSLAKGAWHTWQLALINYLYKTGSNNIWEHTLFDSQSGRSKKKPVSNDPIIPKKESFIIEKYAHLSFAIRPAKDEFTIDDLNKQLWSSVRTGHVETALRLLALGASPNYMDQGNTPLHIAAKSGQNLQVELLWIYGADVEQKNISGQTAAELAKMEKHNELAERLIELAFEMTDHFSMFLCGRKPSHRDNHDFLIPDLVGSSRSEHVRDFRRQLQQSSGVILERLVQDVYDEVDRRELNIQWSTIEQLHIRAHQHVAIFLPPNPRLSATRNQLRQKLAKFSSSDFAHLIIDLLKEIRRRHFGLPIQLDERPTSKNKEFSFLDDGELDETNSLGMGKVRLSTNETKSNNIANIDDQNLAFTPLDHYLELREKWLDTSDKVEHLSTSNAKILKALQQIQKYVEQLQIDQSDIRHELSQQKQQQSQRHVASPPPSGQSQRQTTPPLQNSSLAVNPPPAQIGAVMMSASTLIRPAQQKSTVHNYSTDTYPSTKTSTRQAVAANLTTPIQLTQSSTSMGAILNQQQQQQKIPLTRLIGYQQQSERHNASFGSSSNRNTESAHSSLEKKYSLAANAPSSIGYRKNSSHSLVHRDICGSAPPSSSLEHSILATKSELAKTNEKANSGDNQMKTIFNDEVFPDNLILETELLTNAIKALLSDLQNSPKANGGNRESNAMYHADSINHHIIRILGVIPDSYMRGSSVQQCAIGMESAMKQLSRRCLSRPLNIDETCQAAYDVAKAAKELLVTVHGQTEPNK